MGARLSPIKPQSLRFRWGIAKWRIWAENAIENGLARILGLEDKTEAIESEIATESNFAELTSTVELLEVPAISDTYDPPTNEITRNCKRVSPFWGALITNDPEADILATSFEDILPRLIAEGAFLGQTILLDKDGNAIPELTDQWGSVKVGTHYLKTDSIVLFYVPKGKYATAAAARADLGEMTLTYQLDNPTTEQAPAFEYDLDLSQAVNFKISNSMGMDKEITISNIPQTDNKIISVSVLFEALLGTPVTFPENIVWQNDALPILEEGKSSFVLLNSYDKGDTWFGSIIGTWSI